MDLLNFLYLFSIIFSQTLCLNIPIQSSTNEKSAFDLRDLSYSYAATDIGSKSGSHIKTITVIKNIGVPKFDKNKHEIYSKIEHNDGNKEINEKDSYKLFVKLTDFPQNIFSNLDIFTLKKQSFDTTTPNVLLNPEVNSEQSNNNKTPKSETEIKTEISDNIEIVKGENEKKETSNITENKKQSKAEQNAPRLNTQKLPKDVEFIKSDPIEPYQAKISAKAQSERLVEYAKSRAEEEKKLEEKSHNSHKLLSEISQEFSDYSMHNVKHMNNEELTKKSGDIKKVFKILNPIIEHQKPYIAPRLRT